MITTATQPRLVARDLHLGYGDRAIVEGLSLAIPEARFTAIVGANACGKSTLLRGLGRLLKPQRGEVLLDGRAIHALPTREVATRLGVLPQSPIAPDSISVADLVGRGRYPHQGWFRHWRAEDDAIVARALAATDCLDLADRAVDELSGGQRQRVWIAMALAQETDLLLLDEPTTYLDINHQVEVLELLSGLVTEGQRTVVAVLHDLNLAFRYADHCVVMQGGRILAEGNPREIVTAPLIEAAFGLRCVIATDPVSGTPLICSLGRPTASEQDRIAAT